MNNRILNLGWMMRSRIVPTGQRGVALIMVLMVMVILLTVTGASLLFSGLNHRTASSYQTTSKVLYAAETGAESAAAQMITLMNTVLNPTISDLATITAPTVSGFTFSTFTVATVGSQVQQAIASVRMPV